MIEALQYIQLALCCIELPHFHMVLYPKMYILNDSLILLPPSVEVRQSQLRAGTPDNTGITLSAFSEYKKKCAPRRQAES
ncbi:unnamed protein product [Amoebophrya sp. A25]|nr:unnamed protein product [Amoebophrya sp. A25]|eukprot:GSA25T00010590001.1